MKVKSLIERLQNLDGKGEFEVFYYDDCGGHKPVRELVMIQPTKKELLWIEKQEEANRIIVFM